MEFAREKFLQCWEDVEMVVKLGILQDEKFYFTISIIKAKAKR